MVNVYALPPFLFAPLVVMSCHVAGLPFPTLCRVGLASFPACKHREGGRVGAVQCLAAGKVVVVSVALACCGDSCRFLAVYSEGMNCACPLLPRVLRKSFSEFFPHSGASLSQPEHKHIASMLEAGHCY